MRTFRLTATAAACGVSLVCASSAGAAVSPLRQVTGASPFAIGCAGPGHDNTGRLNEDAEVEPWVAVDPAAPAHVAGAWQQDRWSDGGSNSVLFGYSVDGGSSLGLG